MPKYGMRNFINLVEKLADDGLLMDKASRMDRAQEQGFTIPAWHGTTAKFNEFDYERGKAGPVGGFAPYFADRRSEAKGYADARAEDRGEKGRLMSVLLRIRKPLYVQNIYGVMPDQYQKIDQDLYRTITGGPLPEDSKRERHYTVYDAFRQAGDAYYQEHDDYDHRAIWKGIYDRLKAVGYDAIIHQDTPSDYGNGKYGKIIMLDMSGIRLTSAAFDPSKQDSRDIRA